ncbi:gluconate transporter [Aquirufa antheringensis]|uniref:gluconate:H+ symporter n=1 Tax=Aquirufa antheringensis TaxID=2516559 RepID=UPI0022A83104|nr:gluconate:H+ symporter [Aquirufa antheringensis]MCZ2477248.1 gluconate transporter [Aquirufa antheringensis]
MTLLIVIASLGLLVLLITYWKVNSFISFLLVSIFAGVCFGLPLPDIAKSIQKGLGDTLGSLVVILVLGAMLGKLVAASGAAKQISGTLIDLFGLKNITWGLMLTGFVIGIPLFYNVGFVLMIPLIFSLVQQYKIPPLMAGVPMMASLSVAHGFLPPHPSPAALVAQFHANMGETLILGIMVAIPAIILAGPIFAKTLAHLPVKPLKSFAAAEVEETNLPSKTASFIAALFPVVLLVGTTIAEVQMPDSSVVKFIADPAMVMLVAILVATYVLGIRRGKKIEEVMNVYGEAVKDVAMILLIIAGAGTLKEILLISGVSQEIASYLGGLPIHPLVLGWMMAAIIRVCLGSATIAGLTAAGMIYPLVAAGGVNANLMVLSIGAGSLMFSHVNDTGFWLFKEYFNLTVKETLRSWSLMETIVSLTGLAGVMLLDQFL